MGIDCDFTDSITCPHCGCEDGDSWEFGQEDGNTFCDSCGEEFKVYVNISISYSTTKLNCESLNKEHDYILYHKYKYEYDNSSGKKVLLPEDKWKYNKIMECSVCGHHNNILIDKEEFDNLKIV